MKAIIVYTLLFTASFNLSVKAQKLPNVQQAGLYAPANVKVDGKVAEWGNDLQAYNKSTSVFYTIANNNNNLYLVMRATNKTIVDKILGGGATITISSRDKNNVPLSITTPLLPDINRTIVNRKTNSPDPLLDTDLNELNSAISGGLKEMAVNGLSGVTEPIISVYNEYGIKLAGQLDINKAYTCELAIPLKYINQLTGASGVLNYNIKLNGANMANVNVQVNGAAAATPISSVAASSLTRLSGLSVGSSGNVVQSSSIDELASATDFSGTYTLVKK